MSDLTDAAKAEIADAIRIVREDKFEKFVRERMAKPTDPPPTDPPTPPKTGEPVPPPPKPTDPPPTDPPTPPKTGSKSAWWGEIYSD